MIVGSVVADRFEVISARGSGSMGTVFEARDLHLDRRVAIKVIQEDFLGDDTSVRRFRREARLTARVSHPGVPVVYDIGEHDGGLYLAMEYVDGALVGDVIAEAGPLPAAWAVAIGLQVAAVLACAHRVALIHRDLKPANLMLTPDGSVKVIDFGVAALDADARLSTLTPAGVTAGTAAYQAPERLLGLYSPRSDLYSLGRILRELRCGPEPDEQPDGPGELLRLIDELTAAAPDGRPADAETVVRRLRPLLGPVPPLPAFLRRGADVLGVAQAYVALAAVPRRASVARKPAPATTGAARHAAGSPADVAAPAAETRQIRARVDDLRQAGRHEDAVTLLDAVLGGGVDGARTLDLRRDLAGALFDAGRFSLAADELHTLVPALTGEFGADHAAVLQARALLAETLAYCGEAATSLSMHQALLADQTRLYGAMSRAALRTRRFVAMLHATVGQQSRALNELADLLHDEQHVLDGADATATRQLIGAVRLLPQHA